MKWTVSSWFKQEAGQWPGEVRGEETSSSSSVLTRFWLGVSADCPSLTRLRLSHSSVCRLHVSPSQDVLRTRRHSDVSDRTLPQAAGPGVMFAPAARQSHTSETETVLQLFIVLSYNFNMYLCRHCLLSTRRLISLIRIWVELFLCLNIWWGFCCEGAGTGESVWQAGGGRVDGSSPGKYTTEPPWLEKCCVTSLRKILSSFVSGHMLLFLRTHTWTRWITLTGELPSVSCCVFRGRAGLCVVCVMLIGPSRRFVKWLFWLLKKWKNLKRRSCVTLPNVPSVSEKLVSTWRRWQKYSWGHKYKSELKLKLIYPPCASRALWKYYRPVQKSSSTAWRTQKVP